ncbi:MAG TPA: GAF domain-containing protein [Thermoplasmata archaeon]|nr:GAF domain-containing protein [Thermoplasmata archaeon]
MNVPPRRATPSLLHVDSILHHLHGGDASAEVCRFLRAEFAHFAGVAVYRLDEGTLRRDGLAGEPADFPESVPLGTGVIGEVARDGVSRPAGSPPTSTAPPGEVAVAIRTAGVVEGVLTVRVGMPPSADASDVRFLEQVAAKLAPEMGLPRTRLL